MTDTTTSKSEVVACSTLGGVGFFQRHPTSTWLYRQGQWIGIPDAISYTRAKTSVTSGEFIPGQYRINPYSVKGGRLMIPSRTEGAASQDDLANAGVGPNQQPAIPSYYLSRIPADMPIYVVSLGYVVSQYSYVYKNMLPGVPYYGALWITGDWWRSYFPHFAAAETPIRKAVDFEQLSLQKSYGKLRSADLELGETIGEYRVTIEMLRSPLSALKKFLVDDKSRNWRLLLALAKRDKRQVNRLLGRTGKASLDAMAGTWLELRYGLRPLVMLVQDVIERVSQAQKNAFDPEKIRTARSMLTFGPYKNMYDAKVYPYGDIRVKSVCEVEDTYVSTASVQYRLKEEQSFLDSLGLTPRFLPEVAWQLTTLSFVADWIFTIGPWLATLRINPGIEILGNTSGFRHKRKVVAHATYLKSENPYYPSSWILVPRAHEPGGDFVLQTDTYDRKVNVDLEYVPHFTWGRTIDLFKTIDSVALIWQFAKKFK